MKKIICILFLTSAFAEHNNPNGKPSTLNVKFCFEYDEAEISEPKVLAANMPINLYATIHEGSYLDRYKIEPGSRYGFYYGVTYLGVEAHLPLYKIWKN